MVERDLLLQEKEKLYKEMKDILARQVGCQSVDQLKATLRAWLLQDQQAYRRSTTASTCANCLTQSAPVAFQCMHSTTNGMYLVNLFPSCCDDADRRSPPFVVNAPYLCFDS